MKIKVMADYDCWPLWHDGGEDIGPIDPSTLEISDRLLAGLDTWQATFDASLNRADPASSHLENSEQFSEEGRRLAHALQRELGSAYQVRYWLDDGGGGTI